MLIYRFRVTASEHEEFVREIEILPNQTFIEFHHILVETAELKNISSATFLLTDKKNKVNHEITLKTVRKQVRRFDDDLGEVVMETMTMPLMKDSKIKNYIEDPHQKMMYIFSGKENYTFHIELFKIIQSEHLISYPRVSKKNGEIRKISEVPPPPPVNEDETPALVKPAKIKAVIVPKPEKLAKLDAIEENLDEIREIDKQLSELIEEEAPVQIEIESQVSTTVDEEETAYKDNEEMEHIEEYGDMDQIDQRYSNYREESDEY